MHTIPLLSVKVLRFSPDDENTRKGLRPLFCFLNYLPPFFLENALKISIERVAEKV